MEKNLSQPQANHQLTYEQHEFDVCVIGGGMAGICAAIASARNGARTALIHDRPVFGGNASSEVRMWICGAHGKDNKEAGLLEEIQLENQYRNHALNYSIWDSVLYGKVFFQPNLTPFLNCSCIDAEMDGDANGDSRIASVTSWQLTTQTHHHIRARHFIDCSGDSILAALTPAEVRSGREARAEFDEDIEPETADEKTMGNSLLLQLRRTDETQEYTPPRWAYKFQGPGDLPNRIRGVNGSNFWWLEIGGLDNTIRDGERIRDELIKTVYGVWDYIKNRAPEREQSEKWAVEWIGALPGKRENRRYVGDHILTQNDVRDGGKFDDVVAYGGWSMDDHHPAGIFYPGSPTLYHAAPSPYGIPYRSLYSRNISNLLFAGRNISVTHAALSSTRVMATCALLGQAAGTAAALCIRHNCDPRALSTGERLRELQNTLMDDDCWLPGIARPISDLAKAATLSANGATPGGADVSVLIDGLDRDRGDELHAWEGSPGSSVEYRWENPVEIAGARLVFDSNLSNEKRMPTSYPQKGDKNRVPDSLVKKFRLETLDAGGNWIVAHRDDENYQRLVRVPVGVHTTALRLVVEETWGAGTARIFAFEPLATYEAKIPTVEDGPHFQQVVARLNPADLAAPDSGLETPAPRGHAA
ncbi:MAG TPA: FAD-dependent oxidoreductase [Abditibacteriaceae bacterium]